MTDLLKTLLCLAVNTAFVDPAIDPEESSIYLYRVDRQRERLVLRPDVAPYEFEVQHLGAKWKSTLDSVGALNESECYQLAFRAAVHRVLRTGVVVLEAGSFEKGAHGAKLATESWLWQVAEFTVDEETGVGFGLATVEEMGQVAYSRPALGPKARGPFTMRPRATTRL